MSLILFVNGGNPIIHMHTHPWAKQKYCPFLLCQQRCEREELSVLKSVWYLDPINFLTFIAVSLAACYPRIILNDSILNTRQNDDQSTRGVFIPPVSTVMPELNPTAGSTRVSSFLAAPGNSRNGISSHLLWSLFKKRAKLSSLKPFNRNVN